MIVFPNAKINLGLYIIGKRPDGFHNLETVFYPVKIQDALEIIHQPGLQETIFTQSGNHVEVSTESNLCVRAFALLKKEFPQIPFCKIHLHKHIPEKAGLGGGSADASAMLKLLNETFELKISDEQLASYSLELGSDCPFFIYNRPLLARGRGEILEPLDIDLSAYSLLIVHPGIGVSTKEAFAGVQANAHHQGKIKQILTYPPEKWNGVLENDFEKTVFAAHPAIADIKQKMLENGALFASLSGSGSAVYGIFNRSLSIDFPPHYFQKWL
jgi:4-diphosphocytidyl-2-C-methyl-D-erythritol kinase